MIRWDWMITLAILAALLFVTCQAVTGDDRAIFALPPDSDPVAAEEPVAPGGSIVDAAPQEKEKSPPDDKKPSKEKAEPAAEKTAEPAPEAKADGASDFADFAFPPTMSDVEYHKDAWIRDDCLRCHETGVQDATVVEHDGMASILLVAKCRSCHVLIPGQAPIEPKPAEADSFFAVNAFPPMIPASASHKDAWINDNCLLCHESGVKDAPIVRHKDMPPILLKAKCRSCHVQVRRPAAQGR